MIACYPTDEISINVDNPGHGYVEVHNSFDHEDCTDYCWKTLAGPQLGEALRTLQTAIAEAHENGRTYLQVDPFGGLTTVSAAKVLVSLTTAIVWASAGSENAERILEPVEDRQRPVKPACTYCGEGRLYSTDRTRKSSWCDEHGHTPYGVGDRTWAQAVEKYERDLEWWQIMHPERAA